MQITTDPQKLRDLAGLKTVAEVYRTLDKLAIRKEYHEALLRNGLDLDFIVDGIKDLSENSEEDNVRLRGYLALLKSLGLDEYKEKEGDSIKTWEEVIRETAKAEQEKDTKQIKAAPTNYEVIQPKVPEEELKRQAEEKELGKQLYDEE